MFLVAVVTYIDMCELGKSATDDHPRHTRYNLMNLVVEKKYIPTNQVIIYTQYTSVAICCTRAMHEDLSNKLLDCLCGLYHVFLLLMFLELSRRAMG